MTPFLFAKSQYLKINEAPLLSNLLYQPLLMTTDCNAGNPSSLATVTLTPQS